MSEVSIDRNTLVKLLCGAEPPSSVPGGCCGFSAGPKIVIAQRGFVFYSPSVTRNGDYITLANASMIRRWGTTSGLGQLAASGKTRETILDSCGTVTIHELTVVSMIDMKPGVSLA